MPTSSYTDLLIRLLKREDQGYPVELTLDNQLEFSRGYLSPAVAQWKPSTLDAESGRRLFDLLTQDSQVANAWAMIRGSAPQRRIRLSIDDAAAELNPIPWELLRDPSGPEGGVGVTLAAADATPFSRYITGAQDYTPPAAPQRVKILAAIANPAGLERYGLQAIDVEAEWAALQAAVAGLNVELRLVAQPCTLEAIEEELRAGAHVLHIVAHGAYNKSEQRAVILLANRNNQVRFLHADEHAEALARHLRDSAPKNDFSSEKSHFWESSAPRNDFSSEKSHFSDPSAPRNDFSPQKSHFSESLEASLRLVFLASCETATYSPSDAFSAFAPRLVRAGVPAVLAMQDLAPVETARAFAQVFYRQLLRHGLVDLAANQARAAMLSGQRPGAHIPVLFMRLADGRLLAPSPARSALTAILADEEFAWFSPTTSPPGALSWTEGYLPLPIEVVHLTAQQDLHSFEGQEMEPTASIDILQAVNEIYPTGGWSAATQERRRPTVIALAGGYGANRTTQLKRIVWQTAQDSLQPGAPNMIVPVFVSLDRWSAAQLSASDPISDLARTALRRHWPDMDAEEAASRLAGSAPTLRFVFHNSDNLSDPELLMALKQLRLFIDRHPQHQFVFGISPERLKQDLFAGVDLHVLLLQPLERRKLRHFLHGLAADDPAGLPLLQRLDQSGLYDLAAIPWFMLNLVEHARRGQYPKSRTQVLQHMVEDALAEVVEILAIDGRERSLTRQGTVAEHIERILYALAWRMQSNLASTLPLGEAFTLMKQIRGDREYSLEQLTDALVQRKLLAIEGRDSLRFAYSRIQAYCCARAIVERNDRQSRLDEITSTLGRLSRLHWWEETLVFACGMMADDTRALEQFLSAIVYGMNLLESDRTYLAARCLSEIPTYGPATRTLTVLTETVTAALIWRLSNQNEPNSVQRSRAATLLGQIATPTAMEQLARTAYGKPRLDRQQQPDYDYSNVRMAAIIGLLRMTTVSQRELLTPIDPVLIELLNHWQSRNVAALSGWLHQTDNSSAQGLAALALGDLHMQLKLQAEGLETAEAALAALAEAFLLRKLDQATQWAVTYALATIDLPAVKRAVLDPFFSDEAAYVQSEEERLQHYKCLAYLIGLLRWQDPGARQFLLVRCLLEAADAMLAAVSIDALARLADRRDKPVLERIAMGCPDSDIMPCFKYLSPVDQLYLQRKATDALAVVGDAESVALLRENRGDPANWSPELEMALYRASEEIYWRLR
ncbi:MAG: CHAT domain-containing protein [Anaerolineae bacterium]